MSGTRLTSETAKNFTVLGRGPDSSMLRRTMPLTSVQIVRGRRYQRREDIRRLAAAGYFDTIVLLPRDSGFRYDELAAEFSNLRMFLFDPEVFSDNLNPGILINLAMREAVGHAVLVGWGGTSVSLPADSMTQVKASVLCYLPTMRKPGGELIPSLFIPAQNSGSGGERYIQPIPVVPDGRETESLYPYDYCGLYIRERFLRSGGFDEEIRNPYWQKMEFGYRSRLWGERFVHLSGFRMDYLNEADVEESTPDEYYLRFYLRTMGIRFTGDRAVLPMSRFWRYFRAGNRNIFSAWEKFNFERLWVKKRRYNYRWDVRQMVELWGENDVL